MRAKIKRFFVTIINYSLLWKSIKEVFGLTIIALLPLFINIFLAVFSTHSFSEALKLKVIPGEMLSYSLSFIAPVLFLIIKTHGESYKLPLLGTVSLGAFIIYILTIFLYVAAKNAWVTEVNLLPHKNDLYFKLSILLLVMTIVFRIYSIYHTKNFSDWMKNKEDAQQTFNENFTQSLTSQGQ